MRVSSKTGYALCTLLDLAQRKGNRPVSIADIAERQQIPAKFLEQILLTLKGAGITASTRGPRGGYALARRANEITVGEIVRLLEGNENALERRNSDLCPFSELMGKVQDAVDGILNETTIEDMRLRAQELGGSPGQHYTI